MGIKKALGNYIVSFDSDDILLPNALSIYYKVIEYFNFPPMIMSKWVFSSDIENINQSIEDVREICCTKFECCFKKKVSLTSGNGNLILKKELLSNGYPTDSNSYDDYRLIFRLGDTNPLVVITNPVTVYYEDHDQSMSHNLDYQVEGIVALIKDGEIEFIGWRRQI